MWKGVSRINDIRSKFVIKDQNLRFQNINQNSRFHSNIQIRLNIEIQDSRMNEARSERVDLPSGAKASSTNWHKS